MDPSYAASYNGRGLVLDKTNNNEDAFKDFTKAVNLEPDNPVFIHNRACCLRNMGKYYNFYLLHYLIFSRLKDSLEDFNKALELDNKNSIIYSNIGYNSLI